MAGKIFINYRRDDDPGFVQALYQRLEDEFDPGDLFMDVEGHIKPGDDFIDVLNRQVAQCDVLLAVIGPRWQEILVARASDPDDFVAIEIKAALDTKKRVIPVLVRGAVMPRPDGLPEPIKKLTRHNAVGLRLERFKADCQGLIRELKEQLAAAEIERSARTEAERNAAEENRIRAETETAARAAEAEKIAREQAMAGLSPQDIRKAEEFANWNFIEKRDDVADLRDHLARFSGGSTERYAISKLEEIVWAGLGNAPAKAQLREFLNEFPKGTNSVAARDRLDAIEMASAEAKAAEEKAAATAVALEQLKLRETADWADASGTDTLAAYQTYLGNWPAGEHAIAARAREREIRQGPLRARLYRGAGLGGGTVLALTAVYWAYNWIPTRILEEPQRRAAIVAEEVRRVAEEQRADYARRIAEAQLQTRQVTDDQQATEAQRAAEAQRVADVQRAAEARRVADEQRAAEARRVADEQRVAGAQRVAEEQRVEKLWEGWWASDLDACKQPDTGKKVLIRSSVVQYHSPWGGGANCEVTTISATNLAASCARKYSKRPGAGELKLNISGATLVGVGPDGKDLRLIQCNR